MTPSTFHPSILLLSVQGPLGYNQFGGFEPIAFDDRWVTFFLSLPLFKLCHPSPPQVWPHSLEPATGSRMWFACRFFYRSEAERLRCVVKRLLQFITIREFPPANGHKLPSINKSRWWIPCATRVLALLSNYCTHPTHTYNLYIKMDA